jgi:hypothetical protein
MTEEVKEKKLRKERPILAFEVKPNGDMNPIETFPIGITKMGEALKWARWQAGEKNAATHIEFHKLCATFKAVPQMTMNFEVT